MLAAYLSPLIVSTLLGAGLALFIARRRRSPGAAGLVLCALGSAVWSAGYALELAVPGLAAKLFWGRFQYFGIVLVPIGWWLFALRYHAPPAWLARPVVAPLLLGIPALTLLLVWTNDYHGLIWATVHLRLLGRFLVLDFIHGPWFWVQVGYSYALVLWGSLHLAARLFTAVRLNRWQLGLALVAMAAPWAGNLTYLSHLNPVPLVDWTPITFVLASLSFAVGLFRFGLASLLPIAQQTVFDGLADAVLVLDAQDRVADLNPAAQALLKQPATGLLGQPVAQALPDWPAWNQLAQAGQPVQVALDQGQPRCFELHVSPLTGPGQALLGRVVLFHDITELKQQQARLERARSDLEAAVAARTARLATVVQQLERELSERTLAEQRFADVVEAAPDAMLLIDTTSTLLLMNAQAESLFGYARGELLGKSVEGLIPADQRAEYAADFGRFVAEPRVRQVNVERNMRLRRKDGSEFPVEISVGPLHTGTGLWVACTVRDITGQTLAREAEARLLGEVRQSREELAALAIRLQHVQEQERRQIAGVLHDRVGQALTGLNLNLQIIKNQLPAAHDESVVGRLVDSLALVEETTRQVRDVMADLHPPVLDEYGLAAALRWYAGKFSDRTGLPVVLVGEELTPRLPRAAETALFRVAQEALTNTAKHARAQYATVTLEATAKTASLMVADDGCGFEPEAVGGPAGPPHWGLLNMQQRAASVGGQFSLTSSPGNGTQILVVLRR